MRKEKRERERLKEKKVKEKREKKKGLGFFERWKKSREEAALERERRRKQISAEKERKGRELRLKIERLKQEKDRERKEELRGVEEKKRKRLEEKRKRREYAKGVEEKRKKEEEREIQRAIRTVKRKRVGFNLKNIFKRRPKKELPVKEVPVPEMKVKVPLKKRGALPKAPKLKIEKKFDELKFIKHRIYDARDALEELDFQRARHIYVEIMASYRDLKDKDKAKVYYDIKELYDDRRHAETMFRKK